MIYQNSKNVVVISCWLGIGMASQLHRATANDLKEASPGQATSYQVLYVDSASGKEQQGLGTTKAIIAQTPTSTPTALPLEAARTLQFLGTGDPIIKDQAGSLRTDGVRRLVKGAKWLFYPDGKFEFVPGDTRVRKDLYPLVGRYEKDGEIYRFDAERKADDGAITSVNGVLFVLPDAISLEMVQSTKVPNVSERTAHIRQNLSQVK